MSLFTLLYEGVAVCLHLLATPLLLLFSFKKKYTHAIPRRFFAWKNPPFKQKGIWFHVCSFGEASSLKPLLKACSSDVNISVTTTTGYEMAKKYKASVRYLPFESLLPWWVRSQKLLVVSEAELWYMLFFMAKRKGARTLLINARISDNSYASYQKFSWFYHRIFNQIDKVFAQSEKDKLRLLELGAKEVVVTGNIKAYMDIHPTKELAKPKKHIITLASTHTDEEALLLNHIDHHDSILIVVPRHPERFDEVGELLASYAEKKDLSFHRYSQSESLDSDIIMIDAMGELINIYAISDLVFLGGSFVQGVGGHNPLEPATFGCKVISGKHIFNQLPLFELVENINVINLSEISQVQKEAEPTSIKGSVDISPILEELSHVG